MAYDSDIGNRLAKVRAAIDACLDAQSYSTGDNTATRAELKALREMERELVAEQRAASGGRWRLARRGSAS